MSASGGSEACRELEVIPAIDLRGGRCVRLYQGDYARETVFSGDPVSVAVQWERLGAGRLHVVDLDGAANGEVCHWDIIAGIVEKVSIPVQVGGGIRDLPTVDRLIAAGVNRVVLGTAAVEDLGLVREACRAHGKAVLISVDARDGYASTRGWKNPTRTKATDLALRVVEAGASRIIYTDIASDGTLSQPNFKAIDEIMSRIAVPLIAAGGIATVDHVARLRDMGVEGAIIGRALYSGGIDLREAIGASKVRSGRAPC